MDIWENRIEWLWLRKMSKSLEGWVWRITGNHTFEEGWKGFQSQERTVDNVMEALNYWMFTRSGFLIFNEWEVQSSGNRKNSGGALCWVTSMNGTIYVTVFWRKWEIFNDQNHPPDLIGVFMYLHVYVECLFVCENYGRVLGSIHNSPEPAL